MSVFLEDNGFLCNTIQLSHYEHIQKNTPCTSYFLYIKIVHLVKQGVVVVLECKDQTNAKKCKVRHIF